MSVFVTVSARTYEELMWRKQQMTDMLKSMDMYVSDCSFQQEDALRTVMPFLQISPKLEKKSKRNVLTSGAASTYMFTSFEMSDDTGVLLGINRHNNSLCIVDLFDTKKNKNANLNLLVPAVPERLLPCSCWRCVCVCAEFSAISLLPLRDMSSGERATTSAVSLSRLHRAHRTASILWRSGTPSAQRWN